MNVHTWGQGPRHFFGIHGWGGGFQTFEPLVPFFPEDVTFHSVDLPGYGASPPLGRWRFEDLEAALADVIDALPAPELTLVGNCSGAAFGMLAARSRPQRFNRLVLIDPFAYFPWYFKLLVAEGVGRLFYSTAFSNPVGRWMTNRQLEKHRAEETDLTASFEKLDHDIVYAYLKMLQQIPGYRTFEELAMPITVAHGAKTFEAVQRSVGMWLEMWPQARSVEIAGAGHLPIEESPESLARAIFG